MLFVAFASPASARRYSSATNSSPISISADGKWVWSVNPGAGNVSVIYAKTNKVVATVKTGEEPQSVALDPNNRYAYVANAGSGTVTVIRITRASAKRFRARVDRRRGTIRTGAEPWNVVISPTGRRVFVANSGQGTITVIDTKGRRKKVIGHVNLQRSRCQDPVDRKRQFQPRGLAVTKNGKRLLVTSFFAFTKQGGKQADDNGRQGVVCRLNVSTSSKRIRSYRAASRVTLAPQITGFTIDSNGDGVPDPTSAFPNQLQSIVIRGNQAYLPNIAASPNGPLRFNVDTQAFVSVIDRARSGTPADAGAREVPEPAPRRAPARGRQEEAVLRRIPGPSPSGSRPARRPATWCRRAATCS